MRIGGVVTIIGGASIGGACRGILVDPAGATGNPRAWLDERAGT